MTVPASPREPTTADEYQVIMIVDDVPANLDYLQDALSETGYPLAVFPSGALALERARAKPPALLLLDVRMPGMDGYEVCRAFQSDEALCEVPIIFLSALTGTEDITRGFECGAVDYVTKPFRETEVLARVRTHLALRKAKSDLRASYRKLKEQEALRDRLVHMIVHDMRSPLSVVMGHLQLLEGDLAGADEQYGNDVRTALAGARALRRITDDLLDVSRCEEESLPVHPKIASLPDLVREAIENAVPPDERHRIAFSVPDEDIQANCDPDLTVRILANLLGNALKYSPDAAPVSISVASLEAGGVEVRVRDQGPGIDPQFHGRIFEKFGIVPDEGQNRLPSIGIGLAFCKLAAGAQGGSIHVESELGNGSTFVVRLPAA